MSQAAELADLAKLRALRRALRRQRRRLSAGDRHDAAQAAAAQLLCALPKPPRRLGLYLPDDGEMDPTPLAEALGSARTQKFLPRINPFRQRPRLSFGHPTPLCPGAFGIAAPCTGLRPSWTLDWVLIPLVAFSRTGHRLGRGGGYYDASFAPTLPGQPFRLGVAYAFQECPPWVPASHDVTLDAIVTETGLWRCSPRAWRLLPG